MLKSKNQPLHYLLLTSRLDQLWLLAGLWLLFAIIAAFFHADKRGIDMASGFLGVVLPLLGGVLAAYAFLDDPALELHFAAPKPDWLALVERLGVILAEIATAALAYQVYVALLGIDLSHLGGLAERQLTWLVPTLALVGLGCFGSFALAQTTGGALLVGMVWIVQIILHGWFPAQEATRPFFLFLRVFASGSPDLAANQVTLLGIGIVLLASAWALIKKQERYI